MKSLVMMKLGLGLAVVEAKELLYIRTAGG
jgi:hypothetical protein